MPVDHPLIPDTERALQAADEALSLLARLHGGIVFHDGKRQHQNFDFEGCELCRTLRNWQAARKLTHD